VDSNGLCVFDKQHAGRASKDLKENTVNPRRQAKVRELTDANVVRLAQEGDIVVFERICRLHSRKVRKPRLRIVGAPAAAEDLTQTRPDSYEVPDLQFEASLRGLAYWAWAR
jgi:hypothetical protein